MEDITDADYMHPQGICKILKKKKKKRKKLGEYQHLYVQNDTLLLDNVFENFRNMCL